MNNFIRIVVGAAVLAILLYAWLGTESQPNYTAEIEQQRKDKDHQFKTSADSPFAGDTTFTGLRYFPVDPTYRVIADFVPAPQKQVVTLATSDGKQKHYNTFGYAEFTLHGKKNRLLILEIMDPGPWRGTLFLAFGDETSARETYGAGRYLDVQKPKGKTLVLDFNLAYNPYCAYNHNYSCPLPPAENLLTIPIRAGELNYTTPDE
jgi:uncharacterized protein (DUF1684 family)